VKTYRVSFDGGKLIEIDRQGNRQVWGTVTACSPYAGGWSVVIGHVYRGYVEKAAS
jgi:hypothetical protein